MERLKVPLYTGLIAFLSLPLLAAALRLYEAMTGNGHLAGHIGLDETYPYIFVGSWIVGLAVLEMSHGSAWAGAFYGAILGAFNAPLSFFLATHCSVADETLITTLIMAAPVSVPCGAVLGLFLGGPPAFVETHSAQRFSSTDEQAVACSEAPWRR